MNHKLLGFTDKQAWMEEAAARGCLVLEVRGQGEDPYTHYYAEGTAGRVGYFGDANGSDTSSGIFVGDPIVLRIAMEGE